MTEPTPIDSVVKPKRARLQFGLGGLLLFVLFAGSVGFVVTRWERWAIEKVVERQRNDGAYMILRGFYDQMSFEKSTLPKTLVNMETRKVVSIPPDKCEVQFGPDRFITIDESRRAKIWDWNTGQSIDLPGQIRNCRFSPAGNKLLVWDYIEDWATWEVSKHLEITSIWQVFDTTDGSIKAFREFTGQSYTSTFSSDGTYAVLHFQNRDCVVWNLVRDTVISVHDVLSFTADSKHIVCNTPSSGLAVLNADDGTLVRQINSPEIVRAEGMKHAYQDQLFVAYPGSPELFDTNGARKAILSRFISSDDIQISSDGRHLLMLATDNGGRAAEIQMYDVNGTLSGSFQLYIGAQFSPDGRKVYTRSDDQSVFNIWSQRFPDGQFGHLYRPEVWLAIIFGSLWLWRASVWVRRRSAKTTMVSDQ